MELLDLRAIINKYGLISDSLGRRYSGCIDGEEKYSQFIDDLKAIGVTFTTACSSNRNIGKEIVFKMKIRDHGTGGSSTLMPYDGRPFQMLKSIYLKCAQGGPFRTHRKNTSSEQHLWKKKRLPKLTKKINCQATMNVKCLRVFTEDCYKTKSLTYRVGSYENRKILKKLREALALQTSLPTTMLRYYILMSSEDQHNHTTDTSKVNSLIHPRLVEEIYNFVTNNICSTKTMKTHLEEVVKRMFEDEDRPKPDKLNRCYYPNNQTIRNHLHKALCKIKENKYDQGALEACIQTWKTEFPDDRFAFRPYEVESNKEVNEDGTCSTLLFCHQTEWQQDLLMQYGNDISLLDAAYVTTRYDLPFYFIVVLTDSGYCVVGTIAIQRESSTLLAEALSQFKVWNPHWQPKYFLTHYSDSEINTIQESFPESIVYICPFHREQSWYRWLINTSNVLKEAVTPLKKRWRDIATSSTYEDTIQNITKMTDDPFYQANPNAQEYFSKEWLPVISRWVHAYQSKDFLAKINGFDVESQKNILTHTYLKNSRESTLTALIRTIINVFLPDSLHKYCGFSALPHSDDKSYGRSHDHSYTQSFSVISDYSDGDLIACISIDEEPDKPETTKHKRTPTKDKDITDMKKVQLKLQQNLKLITSYSCMDFTPENLRTFFDMSQQMVETVASLVNK